MITAGHQVIAYSGLAFITKTLVARCEIGREKEKTMSATRLVAAHPAGIPVLATVKLVATELPLLGAAVTDGDGAVLYRFGKDEARPWRSHRSGVRAQDWAPVLTGRKPTVEGIDADLVGTASRIDGTRQAMLNGWPLYRYLGDTEPGQWRGQGVAGIWFAVRPDGEKNLNCLRP
jgi:predicted lipoprotein with Yx(FWY)xxD motif